MNGFRSGIGMFSYKSQTQMFAVPHILGKAQRIQIEVCVLNFNISEQKEKPTV